MGGEHIRSLRVGWHGLSGLPKVNYRCTPSRFVRTDPIVQIVHRISANDRCDPYIAVYASPEPSRIGVITAICWNGLIPSSFVQKILESVSYVS